MVTTDERGFKQVNYSELPYLMLEAIRELKMENDSLKDQIRLQTELLIRKQQEQIKAQQTQIAQLISQVTIIQASLKSKARAGSVVRLTNHNATNRSRETRGVGRAVGMGN
jgi:hypothetical protein